MKNQELIVFEKIKPFINKRKIGQNISRRELLEEMSKYFRMDVSWNIATNSIDKEDKIFVDKSVIDQMRLRLTNCSILQATSIKGVYSIISHIPEEMDWKQFNKLHKTDKKQNPWSYFNV